LDQFGLTKLTTRSPEGDLDSLGEGVGVLVPDLLEELLRAPGFMPSIRAARLSPTDELRTV
jgi:hypothetical protein